MRSLVLTVYFLLTLPVVTVWAASSILVTPGESLPFESTCDGGGIIAESLLRGFCSFGGTGESEPAGDCLRAKTHDDLAVIFNDIADEVLTSDAPNIRIAELGTDGCAPIGAEDALVTAYIDLHYRVMNKLLGF